MLKQIGGAISAAFGNLLPAWRAAWGSLIMAGVVVGLWNVVRNAAAHSPLALAWAVLAIIAGLMAKGAALRVAVGVGRPGPGGLQLGRVELHLAMVGLLMLAFLAILGSLLLVILLCTAYAVASAGPGFVASDVMTWSGAIVGRGRIIFGLVFLAGTAGMIWAATRIALAAPITVASGALQVLKTWPVTRGRVAPILLSALGAAALPAAIVALLSPVAGTLADLARAVAVVGLWLPLGVGLVAYWRRELA